MSTAQNFFFFLPFFVTIPDCQSNADRIEFIKLRTNKEEQIMAQEASKTLIKDMTDGNPARLIFGFAVQIGRAHV